MVEKIPENGSLPAGKVSFRHIQSFDVSYERELWIRAKISILLDTARSLHEASTSKLTLMYILDGILSHIINMNPLR